MDKYNIETVLSVHHWTDNLFSFICTRNKNFKFINGEFTLVGLEINNKPLSRAYSIVSSNYDDYLEFLSIKVPSGPLTSRLKYLKIGDKLLIGKKTTGTLLTNNLLPGKILWLISTGTGLAPFISIIKDFLIYSNYYKIIITHTNKNISDLAYKYYICNNLFIKKYINVNKKLIYYPTLTKDFFINNNRITNIINFGKLFKDLNLKFFHPERDRIMLCGSSEMLKDIINILSKYKLKESKNGFLGHYVIERSFVN